jgi:hypothetical protein
VNSLIEIAVIVLKEERALISGSCDSWIWYCEAIDKKSFAFIHERYWLQATTSKWCIRQARRCHHKVLITTCSKDIVDREDLAGPTSSDRSWNAVW